MTTINNIEYSFYREYDYRAEKPLKNKAAVIKRLNGSVYNKEEEKYYLDENPCWDNFRDDEEIVRIAIENSPEHNCRVLEYISPRLQGNREIVKLALEKGDNIAYTENDLNDDYELAKIAMSFEYSPKYNYKYLSDRMRGQLEFFNMAFESSIKDAIYSAPGYVLSIKILEEVIEKTGSVELSAVTSFFSQGSNCTKYRDWFIKNFDNFNNDLRSIRNYIEVIPQEYAYLDEDIVKLVCSKDLKSIENVHKSMMSAEFLIDVYNMVEERNKEYFEYYVPEEYKEGFNSQGIKYLESLSLKNKLDNMLKLNEVETTTKRMKI